MGKKENWILSVPSSTHYQIHVDEETVIDVRGTFLELHTSSAATFWQFSNYFDKSNHGKKDLSKEHTKVNKRGEEVTKVQERIINKRDENISGKNSTSITTKNSSQSKKYEWK